MKQSTHSVFPASFAGPHLQQSLLDFFVEAKLCFSQKWSKLHSAIVIYLCKISMEYLRLGQCCYSLFQIFQCPQQSYFNVLCFIFWVHHSHTFQCHSAAELAPVKKCTFRDQSFPETNNSTFTGRHQELETLELLAPTSVDN